MLEYVYVICLKIVSTAAYKMCFTPFIKHLTKISFCLLRRHSKRDSIQQYNFFSL